MKPGEPVDDLEPLGPQEDLDLPPVRRALAELAAFAGMGWLVGRLAARYKIDADARDAYLFAAANRSARPALRRRSSARGWSSGPCC